MTVPRLFVIKDTSASALNTCSAKILFIEDKLTQIKNWYPDDSNSIFSDVLRDRFEKLKKKSKNIFLRSLVSSQLDSLLTILVDNETKCITRKHTKKEENEATSQVDQIAQVDEKDLKIKETSFKDALTYFLFVMVISSLILCFVMMFMRKPIQRITS